MAQVAGEFAKAAGGEESKVPEEAKVPEVAGASSAGMSKADDEGDYPDID